MQGLQLKANEFRYLWTVMFTAAIYRGFISLAENQGSSTLRHWAGVNLYTSSCEFAGICVFIKQSPLPILCGRFFIRHLLFRSYEIILPSSFRFVHLCALAFCMPAYLRWFGYGHFFLCSFFLNPVIIKSCFMPCLATLIFTTLSTCTFEPL